MAQKFTKPAEGQFIVKSPFQPAGDQPQAIAALTAGVQAGLAYQTLKGITGSGKTFTIANVIENVQRPTLIVAPNKTLAAQLYNEFKEFFPENRVRYFVSYYDYYQPEAYIPSTDTYIEKDSAINEEIDKMRHSATRALLERRDAIIVASVSCIYGLGAPEDYFAMMLFVEKGQVTPRQEVIRHLVHMQYTRNDVDFKRGSFRVRGETIDVFPSDEDARAIRIIFFGNEVEEIREIDSISGTTIRRLETCTIYPVSHFVTERERVMTAIHTIRQELKDWLPRFRNSGKHFESQRLEQRTMYDLELLQEVGFCPGIENYSRHIAARDEGQPPATLIDYFPDDLLVVIDESHVTVSQVGGMYRGDRSRKQTLVDYGFRLPSALDNRPLKIEEFWERCGQVIFVSATPGDFEIERSEGQVVEQINRPTGLLDPQVEVKPAINQVDDLVQEIQSVTAEGDRVLVTVLTKKMAEDLSKYLQDLGIKARYLHADIQTIERVEILRGLRRGDFDVLIGINLLREGLDLVEVSLVAILDADKEGFLRSTRSLIQTIGRAARNIKGRAIFYADQMTRSMQAAIDETNRRRAIQAEYNKVHGIVPRTTNSPIQSALVAEEIIGDAITLEDDILEIPKDQLGRRKFIEDLRNKMSAAAKEEDFELAASIRDTIIKLEEKFILE